jgi:acetyl-CoA C-acetyltransferase
MKEAYIVDAVRTPIGRYGGNLGYLRPDDLLTLLLKSLMTRNDRIDPNAIEEVLSGAANQAGEDNRNVARMALLMADLPWHIAGVTVNRLCASGLQAVIDAGRAVRLDEGSLFLAGGVESMSRAPFVQAKPTSAFSRNTELYDTTIGWRFPNPELTQRHYPYSMGGTAENVAERWGVSRQRQDDFAFNTQQKYKAAHEAGRFDDELIPVTIPQRKGEPLVVKQDEHPRPDTPREKLDKLPPAFKEGGTVTAANSSGVNDGAAATIVCDEETLKRFNLKPMARIVSNAVAGVEPAIMGIGPIPATQKALKRAGLGINDIGLVELNEAFAAQSLVCIDELGLAPEIVNPNGGAIALGHPLGCSGARILTTLLHEMKRRDNVRYGLATMCVGVGQGGAMIVEKLD